MRQVVLDTETTGLQTSNGHRIIEIGCVELINRKITGKHFHRYINPEREIEEGALAVHGLASDFLADKPLFAAVVEDFLAFIRDAELIIHNAPFDVGFINHELKLLNHSIKSLVHYCKVVDTLALARQLHVGQRNSLDALCKRYAIDNSNRELHGALLDANLLAQVYLAMTGGQGSLFEELTPAKTASLTSSDVAIPAKNTKKLSILLATAEEQAAHEANLQALVKRGKCLWKELED